jgi:hypothetical protein
MATRAAGDRGERSGRDIVLVKAVVADVRGDVRIKEGGSGGGGGSLLKSGANGAGGDFLGEFGQEEEARLAAGVAAQAQGEFAALGRIAGSHGDGRRESGGDAAEIEAGAGGNDKVAGQEQVGGAVPAADGEEGIGAHEEDEAVSGSKPRVQGADAVDGVIRMAVEAGRVHQGKLQGRLALNGEAGHGGAISKAGVGPVALEGLGSHGREEDAVEAEADDGEAREGDVSAVGRVEAAAE